MRIVAMLQTYNEQRFIAACLEHLRTQGVDVYLIDNESTDDTVAIAERYLGRGVMGIETLPRDDCFALRTQLRRKEELAQTLDADWLMHVDADEMFATTERGRSLADALAEVHEAGYNAVNFLEFTFVPTRESPDHDHPDFQQTMRSYYPFAPRVPHRLNAWRRQDGPVELSWSGGHLVRFADLQMAPRSMSMRHYLFLSVPHAIEKFVRRRFADDEVADGWFGWRSRLRPEMIVLPSEQELRHYVADHLLDASDPRKRHVLDDLQRALAG